MHFLVMDGSVYVMGGYFECWPAPTSPDDRGHNPDIYKLTALVHSMQEVHISEMLANSHNTDLCWW